LILFSSAFCLRTQKLVKKGKGKKQADIFKEKEWYDVKAPSYFNKVSPIAKPSFCGV
jgi:hypothetical protein